MLLLLLARKALVSLHMHDSSALVPSREFFGEESVGLLTGDTVWNRKAPIMIMTTEILRNMLYERCTFLQHLLVLLGLRFSCYMKEAFLLSKMRIDGS